MKQYLLIAILLNTGIIWAQDRKIKELQSETGRVIKKDEGDTTQKLWKKGGFFSLNIAQGSLSNWSAGGDNFSLSLNSIFSGFAFYKKDKQRWDNTLDINIGYLKTSSLGARKNDDRIDLLSKYSREIAPKLDISGLFNFRSQFFKGYSYNSDNTKTLSSNFLSPGYVLLSVGLNYRPTQQLSVFASPATVRWTIVKDDTLSSKGKYGVDSGHHIKTEFGAFLTASYQKDFSKTVSYKGRLDLFSNYSHKPQNVDVYMSNVLAVKISKLLSIIWNVELIYDDDIKLFGPDKNSPGLQFKSLVGFGLLVKL